MIESLLDPRVHNHIRDNGFAYRIGHPIFAGATFVLKQELGNCKLSTASVTNPASSDSLGEKNYQGLNRNDYFYFLQHNPDIGHNRDPLAACSVGAGATLSCNLRGDQVFSVCTKNDVDYVFFGPSVAAGCTKISLTAVPTWWGYRTMAWLALYIS